MTALFFALSQRMWPRVLGFRSLRRVMAIEICQSSSLRYFRQTPSLSPANWIANWRRLPHADDGCVEELSPPPSIASTLPSAGSVGGGEQRSVTSLAGAIEVVPVPAETSRGKLTGVSAG